MAKKKLILKVALNKKKIASLLIGIYMKILYFVFFFCKYIKKN